MLSSSNVYVFCVESPRMCIVGLLPGALFEIGSITTLSRPTVPPSLVFGSISISIKSKPEAYWYVHVLPSHAAGAVFCTRPAASHAPPLVSFDACIPLIAAVPASVVVLTTTLYAPGAVSTRKIRPP